VSFADVVEAVGKSVDAVGVPLVVVSLVERRAG
jgi:hypothetical protein